MYSALPLQLRAIWDSGLFSPVDAHYRISSPVHPCVRFEYRTAKNEMKTPHSLCFDRKQSARGTSEDQARVLANAVTSRKVRINYLKDVKLYGLDSVFVC